MAAVAAGWAQKRFQRSAERTWDENAKELAAVVARAAALYFVPDGEQPPRDGIGALLRYAVPGA